MLGAFIIPPLELIHQDGYHFSHRAMRHQDQYSHCWLSFGNLYSSSHRSLTRNCLRFQIKIFLTLVTVAAFSALQTWFITILKLGLSDIIIEQF